LTTQYKPNTGINLPVHIHNNNIYSANTNVAHWSWSF